MNPSRGRMMGAVAAMLTASAVFAEITSGDCSQVLQIVQRDGIDRVLVWSQSGTVTVTEPCTVEVLLVGGGGGGGDVSGSSDQSAACGGGGAGGFIHRTAYELAAGEYAVTVGAGGAVNSCGADTVAFGLTAFGGGNGGGFNRSPGPGDGGSGGGASSTWNGRQSLSGGGEPLDATQGHRGGRTKGFYSAGGGGGAGAAGGDYDGDDTVMTAGGEGRACSITGTEVWYAGGGGAYRKWSGSGPVQADGGNGGGGRGGVAGTNGLGGGGGGNAAGGSGVVILRYCHEKVQTEFRDATGGTVSNSNGCRIHTFPENGVFTIPHAGLIEVLLVGGGGGGGDAGTSDQSAACGGGGAGGFIHCEELVVTGGVYQVTVGAGGAVNNRGADTAAFGLTAFGGGNGGGFNRSPVPGNGGSGGGASSTWNGRTSLSGGGEPLDAAQGNRGGRTKGFYSAGGGGGAGAAGGDFDGDDNVMTAGGEGLACSITGTEVWYAGGGGAYRKWGGSGPVQAAGGNGGGGKGGVAGANGLGGGGGGNAAGGSGVVIVRYRKSLVGMSVHIR